MRHFDFIPDSYVLSAELNEFHTAFLKDRGPWIVKPVASSRGRYVLNRNQLQSLENILPFLDFLKFSCFRAILTTLFIRRNFRTDKFWHTCSEHNKEIFARYYYFRERV